jgi:tRNA U34 5-carboxymethylaminomethyl modifying GTPase MnmE/TrmE
LQELTHSPALAGSQVAFDEMRRWPREKVLLLGNKVDQLADPAQAEIRLSQLWRDVFGDSGDGRRVALSAVTGEGLERLVALIVQVADGFQSDLGGDETIAVSLRHAQALERAQTGLEQALHLLRPDAGNAPATELVASEIRGSLEALGEILGKYDHERMLDRLFAAFCIGK